MFDNTKASPAEVVAEVWRLLEAGDYVGAAGLHTPEFAEYATDQAARDANPRPSRLRTVDALLERFPDMPREVAEYEAAQARKQPEPTPYFGGVFGINSKSGLDALSPQQILARRLQASDWRTRLRPHLERLSEQHPEYSDQLARQHREAHSQWRGDVVGHVVSSPRAYVIVEASPGSPTDHPTDWGPSVVTLRGTDAGWRISSDLTAGHLLVHFHIQVEDDDGQVIVLS